VAATGTKKQLKNDMIEFLTHGEIQEMVERLAKEIEMDYQGKEIVMICPLKGSCIFMSDLSRHLEIPQQIDFVQARAVEKKGAIALTKDISVNIQGKHVLIVEEIIDTGRTLSFLKQRLLQAQPASLKIVTLLDKPARRQIPIKPDYVGMTIEDRYMVGSGMDSEELGRNYRDIFYFTQ
jgi:hypoxanthine phosphoribosyltransferase